MLGAFIGAEEYALKSKMNELRRLTDVLLQYPRAQARYYLHKFCYDAKINYWLRTHSPAHAICLVEDFQTRRMKLAASCHGVHDE